MEAWAHIGRIVVDGWTDLAKQGCIFDLFEELGRDQRVVWGI
jgi:hypothetical protein